MIFGQGALRKSARELLIEMNHIRGEIKKDVRKINGKQTNF